MVMFHGYWPIIINTAINVNILDYKYDFEIYQATVTLALDYVYLMHL